MEDLRVVDDGLNMESLVLENIGSCWPGAAGWAARRRARLRAMEPDAPTRQPQRRGTTRPAPGRGLVPAKVAVITSRRL